MFTCLRLVYYRGYLIFSEREDQSFWSQSLGTVTRRPFSVSTPRNHITPPRPPRHICHCKRSRQPRNSKEQQAQHGIPLGCEDGAYRHPDNIDASLQGAIGKECCYLPPRTRGNGFARPFTMCSRQRTNDTALRSAVSRCRHCTRKSGESFATCRRRKSTTRASPTLCSFALSSSLRRTSISRILGSSVDALATYMGASAAVETLPTNVHCRRTPSGHGGRLQSPP